MENEKRLEGAREFCLQRADTYRLFASVFDKEIKAETAVSIEKLGSLTGADAASKGERMVADGFAGMAKELARFDVDTETELAVDYARVFLNAGKAEGQAAIPYESVYTSEEHLLMQDARDDVRRLYRAAGVMPERQMGEIPDDYVVFELEFMALLNERVVEALKQANRSEARALAIEAYDFLQNHLKNWSTEFTQDIFECAQTKFYQYLAKAYRGFISCERQDTRALVDYLTEEGDEALEDVAADDVQPAAVAAPDDARPVAAEA